ncbi:MAG TPA: GTP cyclohydrolase II [Acetobacteraceae bacterium]|jgi:GTP cyclohydrolase II|nr:GTP cyclohydrolase II [Acetobacteraceae bacterium]
MNDALSPDQSVEQQVLRLRTVHRAAADLRRGTPVLLVGDVTLVLLAAETAGPRGLAELASLAAEPPVLLLAPMRAAAVLHQPADPATPVVALRLSTELLAPGPLRGLADPTVEELLPAQPEPAAAPEMAQTALILAKLARLLPAVLAAPLRAGAAAEAVQLGLFQVPAADLIAYPMAAAAGLRKVASARVPLEGASDSRVIAFRTEGSAIEHLAIVVGHPETTEAPLVRIHSECFTGDLLGSLRCDCGAQLRGAIARMAEEGTGVLLYLSQEGRNIGLVNKLRAYTLQDRGLDTLDANRALGWDADERNFLIAATMLEAVGVHRIRLLTNNPDKIAALAACGVEVVGREAHSFAPNGENDDYLATKAERFGHLLD